MDLKFATPPLISLSITLPSLTLSGVISRPWLCLGTVHRSLLSTWLPTYVTGFFCVCILKYLVLSPQRSWPSLLLRVCVCVCVCVCVRVRVRVCVSACACACVCVCVTKGWVCMCVWPKGSLCVCEDLSVCKFPWRVHHSFDSTCMWLILSVTPTGAESNEKDLYGINSQWNHRHFITKLYQWSFLERLGTTVDTKPAVPLRTDFRECFLLHAVCVCLCVCVCLESSGLLPKCPRHLHS
jgi:hypothetical protein